MTLTEAGSASSLVVGGDLGDPSREVDVLLGHPFDDVLGALVVAVDGVVADQLEVDVPVADRHARVVAERVARLAHRGDEPCAGAEVVDQVAGMQSLGQLAPVGQLGLGDLARPSACPCSGTLSRIRPPHPCSSLRPRNDPACLVTRGATATKSQRKRRRRDAPAHHPRTLMGMAHGWSLATAVALAGVCALASGCSSTARPPHPARRRPRRRPASTPCGRRSRADLPGRREPAVRRACCPR